MLTGATAGVFSTLLFGAKRNATACEQSSDEFALPKDVRAAERWIALRFVDQGFANAGMLVPLRASGKVTVDYALHFGIFCANYKALAEQLSLFPYPSVSFRGASAAVVQPEVIFQDYELSNPAVEIPKLAKTEDAHIRRGRPIPGEFVAAFKFRGQVHGTAGFADLATKSTMSNSAIGSVYFFTSLDDVRLWRLQNVAVVFCEGTELPYARAFTDAELDGMYRGDGRNAEN
jgi:hypothetical protein